MHLFHAMIIECLENCTLFEAVTSENYNLLRIETIGNYSNIGSSSLRQADESDSLRIPTHKVGDAIEGHVFTCALSARFRTSRFVLIDSNK